MGTKRQARRPLRAQISPTALDPTGATRVMTVILGAETRGLAHARALLRAETRGLAHARALSAAARTMAPMAMTRMARSTAGTAAVAIAPAAGIVPVQRTSPRIARDQKGTTGGQILPPILGLTRPQVAIWPIETATLAALAPAHRPPWRKSCCSWPLTRVSRAGHPRMLKKSYLSKCIKIIYSSRFNLLMTSVCATLVDWPCLGVFLYFGMSNI